MENYILAFNGLELYILMIGMVVRETLYEVVLSPLAMSFVTLLMVFQLIQFVINLPETADNSNNDDLMNGKFFLKLLFIIIVMRLLMWQVPVGIKTVKVTINTAAIERNSNGQSIMPKDDEYTLSSGGFMRFNDDHKSVDAFGDSWFQSDQTYFELLGETPLYLNNSRTDENGDEVFVANLPAFIAFPIILVDGLLYGADGTDTTQGIIPTTFGPIYKLIIRDPGLIFDILKDNTKLIKQQKENATPVSYTDYVESMGKLNTKINESMGKIIRYYNSIPYNIYLQEERLRRSDQNTVVYQPLKDLIKGINTFNKSFKTKIESELVTDSKIDLLNLYNLYSRHDILSSEVENTEGGYGIYEEYYATPPKEYDITSNNGLQYPTWQDASYELKHTNASSIGKITLLNLRHSNPDSNINTNSYLTKENGFNNDYYRIRNAPAKLSDLDLQNTVFPTGYFSSKYMNYDTTLPADFYEYPSPEVKNTNQSLAWNIFFEAVNAKGVTAVPGDDLVEKVNMFNRYVEDMNTIINSIYNISGSTATTLPNPLVTYTNSTTEAQKQTEAQYNPSSDPESQKLAFLQYNSEVYFNYYYVPFLTTSKAIQNNFSSPQIATASKMLEKYEEFKRNLENWYKKEQSSESELIKAITLADTDSSSADKIKEWHDMENQLLFSGESYSRSNFIKNQDKEIMKLFEETKEAAMRVVNNYFSNVWIKSQKTIDTMNTKSISGDDSNSLLNDYAPDMEGLGEMEIMGISIPIFGHLVNFFIKVFEWLFWLVLSGVLWIAIYLRKILYSLIYTLHSFGLLLALVTFPLYFIKSIFSKKFTELTKPFLDYLGYRLWDFAIMLLYYILLILVPILVKFFYNFSPAFGVILQLFLVVGIFTLTTNVIKHISGIVGGGEGMSELFGSVGKTVGSKATNTAIQTAGVGAAGITMAVAGKTALGGKAIASSALGGTRNWFMNGGAPGGSGGDAGGIGVSSGKDKSKLDLKNGNNSSDIGEPKKGFGKFMESAGQKGNSLKEGFRGLGKSAITNTESGIRQGKEKFDNIKESSKEKLDKASNSKAGQLTKTAGGGISSLIGASVKGSRSLNQMMNGDFKNAALSSKEELSLNDGQKNDVFESKSFGQKFMSILKKPHEIEDGMSESKRSYKGTNKSEGKSTNTTDNSGGAGTASGKDKPKVNLKGGSNEVDGTTETGGAGTASGKDKPKVNLKGGSNEVGGTTENTTGSNGGTTENNKSDDKSSGGNVTVKADTAKVERGKSEVRNASGESEKVKTNSEEPKQKGISTTDGRYQAIKEMANNGTLSEESLKNNQATKGMSKAEKSKLLEDYDKGEMTIQNKDTGKEFNFDKTKPISTTNNRYQAIKEMARNGTLNEDNLKSNSATKSMNKGEKNRILEDYDNGKLTLHNKENQNEFTYDKSIKEKRAKMEKDGFVGAMKSPITEVFRGSKRALGTAAEKVTGSMGSAVNDSAIKNNTSNGNSNGGTNTTDNTDRAQHAQTQASQEQLKSRVTGLNSTIASQNGGTSLGEDAISRLVSRLGNIKGNSQLNESQKMADSRVEVENILKSEGLTANTQNIEEVISQALNNNEKK